MALSIGTRIGPYEILSAIGAGGMGEVYKARDTKLRRDVALKVLPEAFALDQDRLARFTREAQLLASLNHPHIAQIYGLEEAPSPVPGHPPVHALAMELVDGLTLAELIDAAVERAPSGSEAQQAVGVGPHGKPRKVGRIPIDDALAIARQIAEAVATAHEKGIIHRDLKPGNVMVTADGTVKVLDFGLAKAGDHQPFSPDAQTLANSPTTMPRQGTNAGVVLGTAAYMSPEQARGQVVDKRADIWAFGCVLYEMLTGHRAFSGETITDTLAAIMRDRPDWTRLPAATPPIVRWLLERCLEKDAKQRLQDLGDARLMLGAGDLLNGTGMSASTPVAPQRSPWTARAGWIAAAVCAVGLIATGLVALQHWREAPAIERVAQFSIAPPESMQFSRPTQLAVSPDGEYVVFSLGTGSEAALWLRPLHLLTARPLTGTEGAILPFWSPDSRAIGFFTSGKLMTIRIDGGPPAFVCGVAIGRGATWNRDNVIVFSGGADAPLQRVDATGGTPAPVTTLRPPFENSHRMPAFLPDGHHFLYLAGGQAATGGIAWQIKVGSIDDAETVKVTEADINGAPTFSAGHIVFGRNRALMALRFDPTTRQAAGAPFAVTDQAVWTTSSNSMGFAASPTGLLAFVATSGAAQSRLSWLDPTGKVLGAVGDPGIHYGEALSPDEQRAAVALETGTPRGRDIWIVDLAKGTQSKLTVDPADENSPVWSPDGTKVYFASTRNGASNLFWKAADSQGPETLIQPSDRSQYPSDVTKDGHTLIYVQATTTGGDVWALSLTGEKKPWPVVQGPSAKANAVLSPDGHWLAYQSNETGQGEVYVVPFPAGGQPERLSNGGGSDPVWGHDGKELFFVGGGNLKSTSITTDGHAAANAARTLFPMTFTTQTASARTYSVTRDGQRFLVLLIDRTPERIPITVITNWLASPR